MIREKKERMDAAALRSAILEGYQDAIAGRTVAFNGNLNDALAEFEDREAHGWE